jgi:lysophospholipase L1-like esterase
MVRQASLILLLLVVAAFYRGVRADEPTSRPVTKLACVGDSITFGAGIQDRGHNSYPAQLGRMLGEAYNVRNFGVSGTTLLKHGDRPYDKSNRYQPALDFAADEVVVMLGTNDSKPQNVKYAEEFVADYKDLIEQFRKANPAARIYVCLPVPAFPGAFGITEEEMAKEIRPRVKQVATDTGATLIDLYTPLLDKKAYFPDTIHPNAGGAGLMAAAVYQALTGHPAPATAPTTAPAAP